MSLLTLCSAKGAPGVTTTALVLGALWPRPVLMAECDPMGGDVTARLPAPDGSALDPERGLLSLAAEARRGLRGDMITAHTQQVVGGLDVLAGVRSIEQAQAITALWSALGSALDAAPGIDVLADCGRLGTDPNQLALLRASRGVVLLCRPVVTEVLHLRERLTALTAQLRPAAVDGTPIGVVVIAPPGATAAVDGVRDVLARLAVPIPVLGQLADDPRGAAQFTGRLERRTDRTLLVKSARALAASLAAMLEPFSTAVAEEPAAVESPAAVEASPAEVAS